MGKVVIPVGTVNGAEMAAAAEHCRMIFFAGLPASGKSFFLQQQTLLAAQAGRKVHILRWDAGLAAFETDSLLAQYPEVNGVSNPIIRKAAGVWARQAEARWHADFPDPKNILIGEVPISGNRFVELVQTHQDAAEPMLAADSTVFLVPVPTNELRRKLETKRKASFADPQHADEARDAPPSTMEHVWLDTCAKAIELGLVNAAEIADTYAYDATIYRRFFEHLLQHRNCRSLSVDMLYPDVSSAHDLDVANPELMASSDEVAELMAVLESTSNADEIGQSVEAWYQV
jgi:hypothetical protein